MPAKAQVCPECGADERTGWDEEATLYDGLDLPASAFENEKASRGDKPPDRSREPRKFSLFWWGIGLCITFLITYLVLAGRF